MAMTESRSTEPRRDGFPATALAIGFRPFFLLAGVSAAVTLPLWLLIQRGSLETASPLGPVLWHGHEMLFGFAAAVIAGFVLTAVPNWTGHPTPRGFGLALLAGLWLLARVLLFIGGAIPAWLALVVDVAFLPALAVAIARPLIRARNRRNMAFPALLVLLALLNLALHLAAMGAIAFDPSRILRATIGIIVVIMVVVGGRIIPAFTRNALPEAGVRPIAGTDLPAIASAALYAVAVLFFDDGWPLAVLAAAAGLANLVRLAGWGGLATGRVPLLWILHLGYLWIVLGFALSALAALDAGIAPGAALHAFTAGAIGSLTLGMMTRVSLGHTGRQLVAAPATVLAYAALQAGALLRVVAAFADPADYEAWLAVSGLLWSAAFLLFVIVHAPILLGPRADGRPG
jgi:uncharacterized protein involved in response to NO